MTKKNLETSISINAAPETVWSLVSDLSQMPNWSPQCRWMRLVGPLRQGAYTVNINRQGSKVWPTASKIERLEPQRIIAFRTLTNDSTWTFEIEATSEGTRLTERRLVPPQGTGWMSKTIVNLVLGGEDSFDDEMIEGMRATLAALKAAAERAHPQHG
ncbi:SRPBCC family protein [Mycolicibacter icosiumassiliensis]|uniref:SRPBCC family protein n=1 Tax=Mycolicibacter icosiumassiliensis TaxID=1792835 RepID=UPI00082D5C4E|nr:SRPBCC family protein [Mycolicibacter icosiumassiliensis]